MELGWKAADPPRDRESVALKLLRNDLELPATDWMKAANIIMLSQYSTYEKMGRNPELRSVTTAPDVSFADRQTDHICSSGIPNCAVSLVHTRLQYTERAPISFMASPHRPALSLAFALSAEAQAQSRAS